MGRERKCVDGVTLVELIVALAILAILLTGLSSTMIRVLDLSRTNANRTVAANLAAGAVDELRALPFGNPSDAGGCGTGTLCGLADSDPQPTWTETVAGREFDLSRTIEWSSNLADVGECRGDLEYSDANIIRITVEVSWSRMSGVRPVTTDTAVSPPLVPDGAGSGTIAVRVLDHRADAQGVNGVQVSLSGPVTPPTRESGDDGDGCAVFQDLPRGDYTISLEGPTGTTYAYIDLDQRRPPDVTSSIGTGPRIWASVEMRYTEGGALEVAAEGWAPDSELPETRLPWYASNERPSSPYRFDSLDDTGLLFPGVYDLIVGHCTDSSVAPRDEQTVNVRSGQLVTVPDPIEGVASMTIGSFDVTWDSGVSPDPTRIFTLRAVPPAEDCYDGVAPLQLGSISQGETGRRFALPFSDWTIQLRSGPSTIDQDSVLLDPGDIGGTVPQVEFDAPASGVPTPAAWFDAKSGPVVGSGGAVTTWQDRSGNGRDATAPVGSEPTLSDNVFGPHQAVSFDGGEYLEFDGSFLANTDYTVFAVVQRRSSTNPNHYLGGTTESNNQNLHLGWRTSTELTHAQWGLGAGNDYNINVAPFNATDLRPELHVFRHSSTEGKSTFIDGSLEANSTNESSLASFDGAAIGRFRTSDFFTGDVAEILIYTEALSDADRVGIESYLTSKWNYDTEVPVGIVAEGGDIIDQDGDRLHTFTTDGTFEVLSGSGEAEVLVVGGGGGAGVFSAGGGGGGGGVVEQTVTLAVGSYAVGVGAGGAGSDDGNGSAGSPSAFGTVVTAAGGGGGASGGDGSGGTGASGGGGGGGPNSTNPGSGSPHPGGDGFDPGGTTGGDFNRWGGGGGGADGPGIAASSNSGGNGGPGITSSIPASPQAFGGGGGGGARVATSTAGQGGIGGGGDGGVRNANSGIGQDGVDGTGGGGGGGGYTNASTRGGDGGSGIVVVRYPAPTTTGVPRWP